MCHCRTIASRSRSIATDSVDRYRRNARGANNWCWPQLVSAMILCSLPAASGKGDALVPAGQAPCGKGEAVTVFFSAGEVVQKPAESSYYYYDYYYANVPQACTPEMDQCYFTAKVASGPDAEGYYTIDWDDGDPRGRRVHQTQVKRTTTGQLCGTVDKTTAAPASKAQAAAKKPEAATPEKAAPAAPQKPQTMSQRKPPAAPQQPQKPKELPSDVQGETDDWVPPEIPCTVMVRLHWEGSDAAWNKEAVASLRKKHKPDELIDGFDWHVIMRFNEADRCESTHKGIEATLKKCTETDVEKCRNHKYVKALEYVGDDPETRRKTGRAVHVPAKERAEL